MGTLLLERKLPLVFIVLISKTCISKTRTSETFCIFLNTYYCISNRFSRRRVCVKCKEKRDLHAMWVTSRAQHDINSSMAHILIFWATYSGPVWSSLSHPENAGLIRSHSLQDTDLAAVTHQGESEASAKPVRVSRQQTRTCGMSQRHRTCGLYWDLYYHHVEMYRFSTVEIFFFLIIVIANISNVWYNCMWKLLLTVTTDNHLTLQLPLVGSSILASFS